MFLQSPVHQPPMAVAMGDVNIDIAVELFERGFPEDRIKEALRECSTLGAAVKWLSSAATSDDQGDDMSGASPKEDAFAGSAAPRRRAVRKVASTEQVDNVASPASPPSAPSAVKLGTATASSQLSPARVDASEGTAASSDRSAVVIEQQDATGWWSAAAALWRSNSAKLAGEAAAEEPAGQSSSEDMQDDAAATADSPDDDEEEQPQAAAESEPAATVSDVHVAAPRGGEEQSARQQEGSPKKADSVVQRPPATPCTAIASSPVPASASGVFDAADASRRMSSTPMRPVSGSPISPHTMRINKAEEVCEICCNDVPPYRAVRLGCSHGWYCGQCVHRHAEARLQAGAAVVSCPVCCTPIAERDLRKLLQPDLMERLLSRSLEQAVDAASDLWPCPTPNCPMRVALGDDDIPRFKCQLCNKTSCLKCGVTPYHRGSTCEEFQQKRCNGTKRKRDEGWADLMKWIEETGTKQCPTCRMAVTKQTLKGQGTQYSECHKMLCRNCNTKFCYKCEAKLTDTYSCGCTIDAHGFVNPFTGKRLNHLRPNAAKGRGAGRGRGKAKAAPKAKSRGR